MKQKYTLDELQQHIDAFCRENGWDKNSIPETFLLFTEEVGELAKSIRKETAFKGEQKPENKEHLIEEFADVLNYLMDLANRFDISLTEAYFHKYNKNKDREWK